MTRGEGDLPNGWAWSTIGEILVGSVFTDGDWVESKDQDPDGPVRLVQLADVGEGEFRDRSDRWLNELTAVRLNCTYLRQGDVLFARMPDPIGRACLVPDLKYAAVTVVDVCVIRPDGEAILPAWLMWALNSPEFRDCVVAVESGTTRRRISRKNLATIAIPVPPQPEQERIVAAVEEHLSRLEGAEASVRSAQRRLSQMDASLVNDALDGDWSTTRLGDHTVDQRYGTSAKTGGQGEVPVLRMGNLQHGVLNWTNLKYLPADHRDFPVCLLEPGDLLFNRTNSGELVGKTAVFKGADLPTSFASYLIRARLDDELLPEWAALVMNSAQGRRYIDGVRTQNVGQSNVNGTKLKAFPIPVPPISVQRDRVAEVERQRLGLRRLRTDLDAASSTAAALHRSILAAAFSGRLVAQDSADEPADALLHRIAQERSSAGTKSRTTSKSSTKVKESSS